MKNLFLATAFVAVPCHAQTLPMIDSNGQLSSTTVGDGTVHGVVDFNLQNGDFSRGKYDDDAANLNRLPFAVAVTLAAQLHEDAAGKPDLWVEASSANGFHSPIAIERTSPRAWYDNNNVIGLLYKPDKAFTTALSYAIKTSPNGVSATSHELTAALGYETKSGIGWLRPTTAISVHTRGGSGFYTLFGIKPTLPLSSGNSATTLSIPARFGIGWDDFYGAHSGTATYGSIGLACAKPVSLGSAHLKFRAQMVALFRDDALRHLGKADAEQATVVPLGTLGVTVAL